MNDEDVLTGPIGVYGPNGNRVRDLVAQCRALTPAELLRLQQVIEADLLRITNEARDAAIGLAQSAGRSEAWEATLAAIGDG